MTPADLPRLLEQVHQLASAAASADIHHDLGAVAHRLERDVTRGRTLEPGCAYRLIRLATAARRSGYDDLAQNAHGLATEVVRAEQDPDPDWPTMCEEEGWPA